MRKEHVTAAVLMVLLILLPTTVSFVATSSLSHLKSIKVTPLKSNSLSQLETGDPIHIQANGDFALSGATGAGTPSDPYRFDNLAITSNESCIIVEDTTAHFVISNSRFETLGGAEAIIFANVENGRVVSCEIANPGYGITVANSFDINIENTTIYGGNYGVGFHGVSNSTIFGCTAFYNYRGFVLDWSNHCQIIYNSIYGNWQYGIQIEFDSHNNSIYGNSIGWNDVINEVSYNAIDTGSDNYFDDNVSVGNLWSDFNESEQYLIPGAANSVDLFAQSLEDTDTPILVPLYDTAIDVDNSGNELTWMAYDIYPRSYRIQENRADRVISVWTGGDISYGVDHLTVGTHILSINVTDAAGNEASDEILVSVASFILGGIGTVEVMIASGITVASFVIVIILSKRLS